MALDISRYSDWIKPRAKQDSKQGGAPIYTPNHMRYHAIHAPSTKFSLRIDPDLSLQPLYKLLAYYLHPTRTPTTLTAPHSDEVGKEVMDRNNHPSASIHPIRCPGLDNHIIYLKDEPQHTRWKDTHIKALCVLPNDILPSGLGIFDLLLPPYAALVARISSPTCPVHSRSFTQIL